MTSFAIDDFKGKGVVVTGASSGIGAAVARAFAQNGALVAVHYNSGRTPAEAAGDADYARRRRGPCAPSRFHHPANAKSLVLEAQKRLGRVDILINNAGALAGRHQFLDRDDTTFDEVMNLNVRALIAASQAAVPLMERQGGGGIVNLGSIAGSDGAGPGAGPYGAAKAYVHNLKRHVARDLAVRKIRVNAVAPGVVDTPFHANTPPERMNAMRDAVRLGRLGVPEDCVGPILFLASEAMSGYVTGQIVHVNGDQYMS